MYIFRAKDEIDGKNEEVFGTNENGKLVLLHQKCHVCFLTVLTKYEKFKYSVPKKKDEFISLLFIGGF
jgi:hypothetical protein